MTIIRPRITDFYGIPTTQEELDFAIPFLNEDLPLYLDPFLLWKSPSLQDNALHTAITNAFNHLGFLCNKGLTKQAIDILINASECDEVGLGDSAKRRGVRIGKKTAQDVLSLFTSIPQVRTSGFIHFEEIQLLIDNIAKDRISDIACSFAKSFLVDFTIQNCNQLHIPLATAPVSVYDYRSNKFLVESINLPFNPENHSPVLFVPKRWLRYMPWINYDDYFSGYFVPEIQAKANGIETTRVSVLNYNRSNYDMVLQYTKQKERSSADCLTDPLFKPIPIISAKRKVKAILSLPTGKDDNADKLYEELLYPFLSSVLYPQLDFAASQTRTDSGVLIRDLIFYNNRSNDFLGLIYDEFGSKQIVFELKNVKALERDHINQTNRYLSETLGRFGVIVTRNRVPRAIFQNTIDLWAGQRKCILVLDDSDISMMSELFDSHQRLPIDVLKKKYAEFKRSCPG
jgi:hypothetical protein